VVVANREARFEIMTRKVASCVCEFYWTLVLSTLQMPQPRALD
jgi:hypothetical protein